MNEESRKALWAVSSAGLTAGLMYWADPRSGGRRRALVRDKAVRASHVLSSSAQRTAMDLANRSRGLVEETGERLKGEVPDERTLEERVRSALGRACSHPSAIEVRAAGGRVELKGPILQREHHQVLKAVRRVTGVEEIDDDLEPFQRADNHPALQGGTPRTGARPELLQRNWSSATRFLVGLGALGLLGASLARRGPPGAIGAVLGSALLVRSLVTLPPRASAPA